MMGESHERSQGSGAIQHLEKALEKEDASEKNYHIRQALQYLGVE